MSTPPDGCVPRAFVRERRIFFHHCDPAGIVLYPHYLLFVDEVLQEWFEEALHVDYRGLFLERRLGIPTVRLECDFLAPSRMGDTVRLGLTLDRIGTKSFELGFTCTGAADGSERLRVRAVVVCMSQEEHRAVPIPPDIRASMERWASRDEQIPTA